MFNTDTYYTPLLVGLEFLDEFQSSQFEVQEVIDDCLRRASKDGLAWKRMENIEHWFW